MKTFVAALCLLASGALAQNVDQLWKTNCLSCHRQGEGGVMNTPTLLTAEAFDEKHDRRFFDAIREGKKGTTMKGFAPALSDEQCWALVNYLRELQFRAVRSGDIPLAAPKPKDGLVATKRASFRIEPFVDAGLSTPWAIEFMPDGAALVTERGGGLRVVRDRQPGTPVKGIPQVYGAGQGGLLDVALHPDHASNGWIYLAFSDPRGDDRGRTVAFTKIVRGRIKDNAWVDQEVIFAAKPEHYTGGDIHFGCRLAFGPAVQGRRHLFFCIGERGRGEFAQDLTRPNGKVYRTWDDGSVPDDNPFVDVPDAYRQVWSYGHRNPQGLVFDLKGDLYDTEHAPRGGDELNRVVRGANYGWPVVSYGINYNGSPFRTPWTPEGKSFTMPVARWMPSIAACGLAVADGKAFAEWKGDLLAGGLAGACIHRVRLRDGVVIEREEILHGLGRVRDVVCGPDGLIYVVLNDPDRIVRLVPAS
ncbi:MAG: PQQ-dependent sugar dehydrogenase [Phycisphaerae bacterium]|jgi:glucose/arabinose dehydrogenase